MLIPPGLDVAVVWCAAWIALEVVLIGLLSQQLGSSHLEQRVSARTYRRLGRLNDFLGRRIEVAWSATPSDDIVPDLPALLRLETEVMRAIAIQRLSTKRLKVLDLGRTLAILEIAMAATFAGIALATGLREQLNVPAFSTFAIGTVASVLCLTVGAGATLQIEDGEDFL